MRPRFTSREAITLYLVVFALFVGFFLLGLSLGRIPPMPGGRVEGVERRPVREVAETPPPARVESVVEPAEPSPSRATSAREREPIEEVIVDEPPILEDVEEAPPAPVSAPEARVEPTTPPRQGDRYTIQVAALSTQREAQQAVLRLEANNFSGRIQPPTAALGGRFYRVWVGDFRSADEARDVEDRLKAAGFLTYVRKVE